MACAHDTERDAAPESADALISHFVPSVELTGSRDDKLRKLDTLIVYLQGLRERLAADTTLGAATTARIARPAWQWFAAGFLIGAVCVLLLVTARRLGL